MQGSKAEMFMRDVERRVLDEHHKLLPFWSLEPATALLAMVEAFDSFAFVQPHIMRRASAIGVWQYVKSYQEGFVHALRLMWPRCRNVAPVDGVSEEDIDKAGAFLNYMADYAQVAMFHVGFGKGLYAVEADEPSRVVRFRRSDQPNHRAHLYFGDLIARRQASVLGGRVHDALSIPDFAAATGQVSLENGRIAPSSASALVLDELRQFHRRAFDSDPVPLDRGARIGNWTYADFQAYWINLSAWSTCAVRAYLTLANGGTPQSQCMCTQQLPRDEFVDRLVHMSALPNDVVDNITTFLTYDERTPRPDPFLQPLIVMGDSLVFSPYLVALSRQPRNLLKLLCQTRATQKLGATLNGSRERALLRRFGEHLQSRSGYSFKLNIPLKCQDEETELDLLAYQVAVPSEVLLVQGKTPVATDDIHEVDAVSREFQRGASQCEQATRILKAMPLEHKRKLYPFVD